MKKSEIIQIIQEELTHIKEGPICADQSHRLEKEENRPEDGKAAPHGSGYNVVKEDYSQRARNFRVALRRRLEKMKPGQVIRYGKLFWTAQGKNNFRDSLRTKLFPKGRMTPGQDVVQALKFAVQPDIMKHRGASGDDMVNAYLKFEGKLSEGADANRWFSNLKYYYQKGLSSPDLKDPAEKKAYIKLAKQFFSKLKESFNEGKMTEANRGKVFKAAKKGSFPATIVVVQNGKVIHQEKVSTPEAVPAKFNVMQEKYPKALIHLEDSTGKRLFSEAVYDNILKAVPDSYSYKALAVDIARMIKDEYGSHNIKPFTKALMQALKEGKITIDESVWKHFDAKMKLYDEIMDVEDEMRDITNDLKQLHIDMEQEAEPGGGPKATKYGREIEKKEKEYKKKKAEFKKLMAKLDKMEQY